MTLTATDLFAGGGGSSEGLRQAGYDILACANHNPTAVATHQLNHPDATHFTENLQSVDFRRFPRTNVCWVSPSCTAQSPAGGRRRLSVEDEMRRSDPRAVDRATAFAVIAATEVHHYDAVIVENVPEFTSWVLFDWWLAGMTSLGYKVQAAVLDAADFGLAQRRRRWFAVFTRDGSVDLTPPTPHRVSAASILDDDPGKPVTRRLYVSPQIDEIVDRGVPHLVTYRRNAHARRADQHPLATVTAGGNHHAVATLAADGPRHRLISNRECARAQGFPDTYRFMGTAAQVKSQVGMAVPVAVAKWIGGRVAEHLEAGPQTLAVPS